MDYGVCDLDTKIRLNPTLNLLRTNAIKKMHLTNLIRDEEDEGVEPIFASSHNGRHLRLIHMSNVQTPG